MSQISVFNGSIKEVYPTETIDLATFASRIEHAYYKTVVDQIRAVEGEERKELKRKLVPSVTVSGTFNKRADEALVSYSCLIAIDIDHREADLERVRTLVNNDDYTYCSFVSVSGSGLCAILKTTDAASHADHFRWAEAHYKKIGDIAIDQSCKNISRARFVSYDPNLYMNPKAKTAGKKAAPKSTSSPKFIPTTSGQIDRIVSEICGNGHNIADSYEDFLTCAFAIANELGEGGRQSFHNIATLSSKYDPQECDKKYTNALNTGNGKTTIASFFHLAKSAGVEITSQEEKRAFTIAKSAKRSKSDVAAAVTVAENTGVSPAITKEIAEKVFESNDYDELSEGDSIINEIAAFIKINSNLERNKITKKIEDNGTPIDDMFYNSVYIKAKSTIVSKEKVSMQDVRAIIESDIIPQYCPIQRWLDQNQHLPDDPGIIDRLLDTIPYEKECAREFIRPWLIGIPSSYRGDVVRLVLVLCGAQETGKTWWLRHLFPPELKPYWSDTSLMDDSEVPLIMSEKLVNLDDEFGGKSRKDALKFKELTSKRDFDVRLKYGRVTSRLRRICMLCGTSNETEILNDETGNTRILPVEFNTPYNWDAYNAIDKTQLMIEIFRAQKRGESWQLNDKARIALAELNEIHKIADFELELIDMYLEVDKNPYKEKMQTTTEIRVYLERVSGQKITHPRKLGVALKKRFEFVSQRIKGKPCKGYRVFAREATTNDPFERETTTLQVVNTQDVAPPF